MRAKSTWLVIGALALAEGVAVGWKRHAVLGLNAEVVHARAEAQRLATVGAERERLLAAQPGAGEVERVAINVDAIRRARAEIALLRKAAEGAERAEAERKSEGGERFAVGSIMPAADWKNAGIATAKVALETVLWAGAGGDVQVFADTLTLWNNEATRKAAQALLEKMPDAIRAQCRSPEQLVAFLTIKDIPLGAVEVREFTELEGWPFPALQAQLLLTSADGKTKPAALILIKQGDGWQLLVMESVIAKYAAMLASPVPEKK